MMLLLPMLTAGCRIVVALGSSIFSLWLLLSHRLVLNPVDILLVLNEASFFINSPLFFLFFRRETL